MISNANIIQNDSHCKLLIQSNLHDGPDNITNGDFATDSDWTKGDGWTISSGVADCDGTQAAISYLSQDTFPPAPGTALDKHYKVNYTITRSAGSLKIYIGNQGGTSRTASGSYEDYINPVSGPGDVVSVEASSDFVGTVDNITVVEVFDYIIDSSRGGATHVITNSGGVVHSTSQKKHGFSSLYFDGSDDYLSIPDSDDFNFGAKDFTIELWALMTDNTIFRDVINQQNNLDDYSWWIYTDTDGHVNAAISPDGTSGSAFGLQGTSVITNSWKHILISRSGNNFMLFVDGVSEDSEIQDITVYNSDLDVRIGGKSGAAPTDNPFIGYIAEVGIHKGIALHTRNFTPPNRML